MGGGGKNASQRQADDARRAEEARQARIRTGTANINETFEQFDDGFYDSIRDGFVDFATPDFEKQYSDAREQATYNLARAGTLDSSIRAETFGDLEERRQTELQNLFDQARTYETDTRSQVENARADLISQLQVTGDATGAANAALAQAKTLATPPTYTPLQQLFQDAASTLATQAALERAEAYGSPVRPRFNTGLFGPSRSAVQVT